MKKLIKRDIWIKRDNINFLSYMRLMSTFLFPAAITYIIARELFAPWRLVLIAVIVTFIISVFFALKFKLTLFKSIDVYQIEPKVGQIIKIIFTKKVITDFIKDEVGYLVCFEWDGQDEVAMNVFAENRGDVFEKGKTYIKDSDGFYIPCLNS